MFIKVKAEKAALLASRLLRMVPEIRETKWNLAIEGERTFGRRFLFFRLPKSWSDARIKKRLIWRGTNPGLEHKDLYELAQAVHHYASMVPADTDLLISDSELEALITGLPCLPDLLK